MSELEKCRLHERASELDCGEEEKEEKEKEALKEEKGEEEATRSRVDSASAASAGEFGKAEEILDPLPVLKANPKV